MADRAPPSHSRDLLRAGAEAPRSLLLSPPQQPQAPCFGALPPSALLGRLSAFVPQLGAANAALEAAMQSRPAHEFDLEHLEAEDSPHVEMELACGVVELRDQAAQLAAERALAGVQPLHCPSGDEGSDNSGDDSSEEEEEEGGPALPRAATTQKRSRIEELPPREPES